MSTALRWFVDKVCSGEDFQITDVSTLSKEADSERSILEAQGIQSVLIMPFGPEERPTGYIGFDSAREVSASA